MKQHPNNVVSAMRRVGYTLADMLPAYPGKDLSYLDQLLCDCSLALSRPLLPYGVLGIHPCSSQYFNVSESGFRFGAERGQRLPPDSSQPVVFFFGGSTTAGFNVEDGMTVPAQLQRVLRERGQACEVYNFGSGSYTSRHEALRFLELIDRGVVPDIAIFLDGVNECFYAYGNPTLPVVLDELYQNEKRRRNSSYLGAMIKFAKDSWLGRRRGLPSSANYHPAKAHRDVARLVSEEGINAALAQSTTALASSELSDFHQEIGLRVWNHYLDSVEMITALSKRHKVQTLFVWQPVPFFQTESSQRVMDRLHHVYKYDVLSAPVYNWLHHENYPKMSERDDFLNLSAAAVGHNEKLYVDICHYSDYFCGVLANAIADKLLIST